MTKFSLLLVILLPMLAACGTTQVVPQQAPQATFEELKMCPATAEEYKPYYGGHSSHTMRVDENIKQIQLAVEAGNIEPAKVFLKKYFEDGKKLYVRQNRLGGLYKLNIMMANIRISDHTDLDPRCGEEQKLLPAM